MSRKNRFVKNLTELSISSLEKGYKAGKSHLFRRKCHCILLSYQGQTVEELSKFFNVSPISIYSWFNSWESFGIKGLELKAGRGRPPKIAISDKQKVDKVKELIQNEPQNLNRVISQVKTELDVDLSKKTLQRLLKNLTSSGSVFVKG
jgi:transposase